jgi:hypothetical protein
MENKKSLQENNAKEFMVEYRTLVKKYGLTFVANPEFIQRDDGTFSIVVRMALTEVETSPRGVDKE